MSKDLESIIKKISETEQLFTSSFGVVISVNKCVACVIGLSNSFFYEVVCFSNGDKGIIVSMDREYVNVVIFGKHSVSVNMEVQSTSTTMTVKLSENLIGKILNGYGKCSEDIEFDEERPVEIDFLQIKDISEVTEQVITGMAAIDWFCPVGYGQREAVISPYGVNSDKIIKFTILNLKDRKKTLFIYCGIGQKVDYGPRLLRFIKENKIDNFIFIIANSSDDVFMRDICPFVACTIAEYFKSKGYDVIVFLYDLTEHAIAHREIALITGMNVGREAYPADITYVHSRILERFANSTNGSMTCFPFAMLGAGEEMSGGYIQTNIISITDGQLLFSEELFNKGKDPAMNIGQSVSRIGTAIQNPFLRKLCGTLKLEMARAEKLESSMQFSSSLSEEDEKLLKLSKNIGGFLNQTQPYPLFLQILILYSIVHKYVIEPSVLVADGLQYSKMEKGILAGDEGMIQDILCKIGGQSVKKNKQTTKSK
jgi:F-type H+-transporting ATPase subunit alpha